MTERLTRWMGSVGAALLFLAGGCMTPSGETMGEQRASVRAMRRDTVNELVTLRPELKQRLVAAPGYGAFSNFGLKILLAGQGNGYGLVHDNRTGREIFMRMAQVNVGLGYGVKKYRAVFIFNDPAVFRRFVEEGWEFGGTAQASAKVEDRGGTVGAASSVNPIDIFLLTDAGLALEANLQGTKYWQDDDLNNAPDDLVPTKVQMQRKVSSAFESMQ